MRYQSESGSSPVATILKGLVALLALAALFFAFRLLILPKIKAASKAAADAVPAMSQASPPAVVQVTPPPTATPLSSAFPSSNKYSSSTTNSSLPTTGPVEDLAASLIAGLVAGGATWRHRAQSQLRRRIRGIHILN